MSFRLAGRASMRYAAAMARGRTFAIVPAAGVSARMGAHKLLLPWGGSTVIEQVLAAWQASRVDRVTVVARADDEELLFRCKAAGVDSLATAPTPDMKASVRLALEHIEWRYHPSAHDAWLLAPADMPRLSAAAIDAVIDASNSGGARIVAPSFSGRRGHPTLFPWQVSQRVAALGPDDGINTLLAGATLHEVLWHNDSILRDVDTPSDYAAALASSVES